MQVRPKFLGLARSIRAAYCAAVYLCVLASPNGAQTPEAYKQGRQALEAQDWENAAQLFRQAIAENSQEKKRRPRHYLPHYFLGRALYGLGDCRAALGSWERSASQGIVLATGQAKTFRSLRNDCTKRVESVEASARVARKNLDQTETALEQLYEASRHRSVEGVLAEGLPSFPGDAERIKQTLSSASQKLERGVREVAPELVQQAIAEAEEAAGERSALARELALWRNTVEELLAEERSKIHRLLSEVSASLRKGDSDPALWQVLGETEPQNLNLAEARSKVVEIQALLGPQQTQVLEVPNRNIPGALLLSTRSFLTHQYERALNGFDPSRLTTPELRAHGYLIQAAAQFALNRLSPIDNSEGDAFAAQAVLSCHRENPFLRPDTRSFSPAFVSFFEKSLEELNVTGELHTVEDKS